MKINRATIAISMLTVVFGITLFFPAGANAQKRDYLTYEEIELVRNANEIDKRIAVLVSAIDRRFSAIRGETWEPGKKDKDEWGALPAATRFELLSDISKILQKAIDDIDDLAARREIDDKVLGTERKDELDDETGRLIRSNNKNFAVALHHLAGASRRYLPVLEALAKESNDRKEQGAISGSIESCDLIIEAADTIPMPSADKKSKNKGN